MMRARAYACIALVFGAIAVTAASTADAADSERHILWSLKGKTNTVYLLGSFHLLKASETLPAAIDSAYADAEKLVMEIDMDDLDPVQMQQAAAELAMLPPTSPCSSSWARKPTSNSRARRANWASTRQCSSASAPGSRRSRSCNCS